MNFSIGMLVVSMGEYLYMRVYAYILVLGMSVSIFVLEFLKLMILLTRLLMLLLFQTSRILVVWHSKIAKIHRFIGKYFNHLTFILNAASTHD